MKKIINIIASISILCGMFSCENFFNATVELEQPPHDPILVVHSVLDQSIPQFASATVGRSYGLFEVRPDNFSTTITNANVELFRNGELYATLDTITSFSNLEYGALLDTDTLVPGTEYELRISHPDYTSVSAKQIIPMHFAPTALSKGEGISGGQFGEQIREVNIRIDDAEGENFYEFSLIRADTLNNGEISFYQEYFETMDQNIERGYNFSSGFITDRSMIAGTYNLRLNVYDWEIEEEEDRQIFVLWRSVTADYYEYSTSLRAHLDASNNPFSEPVSLYNNVEGGLGFFGAHNGRLYLIE